MTQWNLSPLKPPHWRFPSEWTRTRLAADAAVSATSLPHLREMRRRDLKETQASVSLYLLVVFVVLLQNSAPKVSKIRPASDTLEIWLNNLWVWYRAKWKGARARTRTRTQRTTENVSATPLWVCRSTTAKKRTRDCRCRRFRGRSWVTAARRRRSARPLCQRTSICFLEGRDSIGRLKRSSL